MVIRGFEEEKIQSTSSTSYKPTFQIVTVIRKRKEGWKCEIIDIKTTFLQGRQHDRDIFVMPPIELKEDSNMEAKHNSIYT